MDTRQDIAYLSDLGDTAVVPSSAVQGNIVVFGEANVLQDSGRRLSDYPDSDQTANMIDDAVAALKTAVDGEYAISAYKASDWAAGTLYYAGTFCMHNGVGYRCLEEHVSGLFFDASKWEAVLSSDGKNAIDLLLADYPKEGLARLVDIAPMFNAQTEYIVGQLSVVDGVLKACTRAGRGAAAQFAVASVEDALALIRDKIDTAIASIKQADWNVESSSDPAFIRNKPKIEQADWDETDSSAPAFIRNKPEIPDAQVQADWDESASSAPAFIRNKPEIPEYSYRIVELVPEETSQPGVYEVQLEDRAVNSLREGLFGTSTVRMLFPARMDESIPRDFYIVLEPDFDANVTIRTPSNIDLEDCEGRPVSIEAIDGIQATYRLTEVYGPRNEFVVSMFADPALRKVKEIEQALDEIIRNEGMATFTPGTVIADDSTGLYYRLEAVRLSDTGEVAVGVDQDGIPYGDGGTYADVSSSSASGDSPGNEA